MSKLARELLPFGSLVLIICILSAWQPDSFLTLDNFLNVLRRSSVYGIIAVGMTFVLLTGGIDLSVGSVMGFIGALAAVMREKGWRLGADVALVVDTSGSMGDPTSPGGPTKLEAARDAVQTAWAT